MFNSLSKASTLINWHLFGSAAFSHHCGAYIARRWQIRVDGTLGTRVGQRSSIWSANKYRPRRQVLAQRSVGGTGDSVGGGAAGGGTDSGSRRLGHFRVLEEKNLGKILRLFRIIFKGIRIGSKGKNLNKLSQLRISRNF